MFRKLICLLALSASTGFVAFAQDASPSPRSEVSILGSGSFTNDSNGAGISQRGTNGGGFLVGYRFNFNRWTAAEAEYGYTRNTQYFQTSTGSAAIQSNIHFITGDFVLKAPTVFGKLHPYALAGAGALIFDPTSNNTTAADLQSRPAFLYGGGVDLDLTRHIAFRAEYRGYVYQAPNFDVVTLKNDATTHLAQPSAGIVFRF